MKLDSQPLTGQETTTSVLWETADNTQTSLISVSVTPEPEENCPSRDKTPWGIFATTFVTIFLAEIGDKTQLSTLLMSAESHSPWMVFIGSAIALLSTSLLGVLVGTWMATKLSPRTINKAAGLMLLFISLMLFWDIS